MSECVDPSGTIAALRNLRSVVAGIDAVRAALTRDQLLYAEYRRNVECHPFQTGYEWVMNGAQERVAYPSKAVGAPKGEDVPLDEVEDAIVRLLGANPREEWRIAVPIARAVVSPLSFVAIAAQGYELVMEPVLAAMPTRREIEQGRGSK